MKNGYEAWLDNPNHGLDHLSGWKIQLWDALPRHSRGCRLAHPSARLAHSLGGSLRFHPGPMRLMLKMRWQLRCEQSPATALPLPRFSVVVSNWSSSVSKRAVFKNTWSTRDWSICRFVSCSFCHALATPVFSCVGTFLLQVTFASLWWGTCFKLFPEVLCFSLSRGHDRLIPDRLVYGISQMAQGTLSRLVHVLRKALADCNHIPPNLTFQQFQWDFNDSMPSNEIKFSTQTRARWVLWCWSLAEIKSCGDVIQKLWQSLI